MSKTLPANPFPELLSLNDGSGLIYRNKDWQVWERCQKEHMEYFREAIQDPIGLLWSAAASLERGTGNRYRALRLIRSAHEKLVDIVNSEKGG